MEKDAPFDDKGPVKQYALAVLRAPGDSTGQQLPSASPNIHHALGLAPGEGILEVQVPALQAMPAEVGHGLHELCPKV